MRIKLLLEYDGTNYSGWQWQSGQDSIQARLEAALEQIFGQKIRIQGAGRTDAGVHALGQVAAFSLPREFPPEELRRALNALIPPGIVVREAAEVAEDFDPRRQARLRIYHYRILNRPWPSAFDFRYSWLVKEPLDLEAMQAAAKLFVGEHDFAAFRTLGSEVKSTVRRVHSSRWDREGSHLIYRIEATSFLRHMVRTMVAAMADVGRSKMPVSAVSELLASRERGRAPAAAPARGLFLVEVRY